MQQVLHAYSHASNNGLQPTWLLIQTSNNVYIRSGPHKLPEASVFTKLFSEHQESVTEYMSS